MAPNCPAQRFFGDYKRFTPGGKLGLSVYRCGRISHTFPRFCYFTLGFGLFLIVSLLFCFLCFTSLMTLIGPYFENEPKDETLSTNQCYNDLFSLARDTFQLYLLHGFQRNCCFGFTEVSIINIIIDINKMMSNTHSASQAC